MTGPGDFGRVGAPRESWAPTLILVLGLASFAVPLLGFSAWLFGRRVLADLNGESVVRRSDLRKVKIGVWLGIISLVLYTTVVVLALSNSDPGPMQPRPQP